METERDARTGAITGFKKALAKTLAGIAPDTADEIAGDLADYMGRVFQASGESE